MRRHPKRDLEHHRSLAADALDRPSDELSPSAGERVPGLAARRSSRQSRPRNCPLLPHNARIRARHPGFPPGEPGPSDQMVPSPRVDVPPLFRHPVRILTPESLGAAIGETERRARETSRPQIAGALENGLLRPGPHDRGRHDRRGKGTGIVRDGGNVPGRIGDEECAARVGGTVW